LRGKYVGKVHMRTVLLFASLLALMATAPAYAKPADRAAALAAFRAEQADEQVPAGWTGSVDGCVVGTESADSLAATLRTVNALRDFTGLGPVSFDDSFNHKALAAALMMRAKNDLNHNPDPSWPCYSDDGHEGANHSNLFLGSSGPQAIVGYVDDSDVASLGHRMWVLDPGAAIFGSGSTGTTNALYVVSYGTRTPVPPGTTVAWPPSGFVPWQWVFGDWSVHVEGDGQTVSFQDPQVSVTVDGQAASVHDVRDLGQSLTWKVDLADGLKTGDHVMHVTVTGATVDGQALPIAYDVSAFAPDTKILKLRWIHKPSIARSDGRKGKVRPGVRLKARASVADGRISGYQWLRGGKAIGGASKSTYKVRRADRGKRVACRVTAVAGDGSTSLVRTSRSIRVAK
jgi:uncharacterized protein YkwD